MSEFPDEQPPEIVDIDQCSSKMSILIGAATTFVLSFIPIVNAICCLHYVFSGVIAVWHFTSRHSITIETMKGFKVAFFAILLGGVSATIVLDVMFLSSGDVDLSSFKEMIIEEVEAEGGPQADQAVEIIEKFVPEELTAAHLAVIFVAQMIFVAIGAAITGIIGGSLGAAMFKKGAKAQ